jgi:hypothetical protein
MGKGSISNYIDCGIKAVLSLGDQFFLASRAGKA